MLKLIAKKGAFDQNLYMHIDMTGGYDGLSSLPFSYISTSTLKPMLFVISVGTSSLLSMHACFNLFLQGMALPEDDSFKSFGVTRLQYGKLRSRKLFVSLSAHRGCPG